MSDANNSTLSQTFSPTYAVNEEIDLTSGVASKSDIEDGRSW